MRNHCGDKVLPQSQRIAGEPLGLPSLTIDNLFYLPAIVGRKHFGPWLLNARLELHGFNRREYATQLETEAIEFLTNRGIDRCQHGAHVRNGGFATDPRWAFTEESDEGWRRFCVGHFLVRRN